MQSWAFDSRDPEATLEAAAELGRSIGADGLAIALVGPLGAGKTVFVKGLATGLGVDPRLVSSPTFVIAQQYRLEQGPEVLHHLDLYRLESELELESIGFYDMLAPGAVLAVEWADRFPDVLGRELLSIELDGPTPDELQAAGEGAPAPGRRARVTARGSRAERVLEDWASRVERRATRAPSSGGGGAALSSPRMRAIWMLVFALAVGAVGRVANGLRFSEATGAAACERLVELEADRLGSLSVRCARPQEVAASSNAAGTATEPSTPLAPTTGLGRLLEGGRIDLNRAPTAWLQALPEIGPARAAAIERTRAARPFADLLDLERTPGIGPRIRAGLTPWLRVASAAEGERDG